MALPLHYHWRNLFVRKTTTLLTILVIAVVIATYAWVLGFYVALGSSLSMASDDRKLIVIQRSSTSETNSSVAPEEYNRLASLTGVEIGPGGEPCISHEMYWQTQLPRLRDGGKTRANVAVRGVTERAYDVHRSVAISDGRRFQPGAMEIVAGKTAAKQFAGLNIGDVIKLGFGDNREFRVVGHFDAGGGPMESEIWAYLPVLQSAYQRNSISSAAIRLKDGVDPRPVLEQIRGPSIQLNGQTEAGYWSEQSSNIRVYQLVCFILIGMMALAAIFSIANTMYAMVAGRTREIAMLRTIGYPGTAIMLGFLLESVMLSLLGGLLGCLGCAGWLLLLGNTKDMFGASSFTAMAFEIRLTPLIVAVALVTVVLVGALGALLPARRAARTHVLSALREA